MPQRVEIALNQQQVLVASVHDVRYLVTLLRGVNFGNVRFLKFLLFQVKFLIGQMLKACYSDNRAERFYRNRRRSADSSGYVQRAWFGAHVWEVETQNCQLQRMSSRTFLTNTTITPPTLLNQMVPTTHKTTKQKMLPSKFH